MQILINENDFQRLRPDVQDYLLEHFKGKAEGASAARRAAGRRGVKWREPVDITADEAQRLVHGLSEEHQKRLALFTKKGGRVRMKEILALTGEEDLRTTTRFQTDVSRRLQRIIGDTEKKAQLMAWDFEATKWDNGKTTIVDGIYYVSDKTAASLKAVFSGKAGG